MVIYPNPVVDYAVVEKPQKSILEVLTIQGQMVKTINGDVIKTTVYLGNLPGGLYVIKAVTDNSSTLIKFIKL